MKRREAGTAMFVTYALATGLALACVGLYQEVAAHRRWSRFAKWWGSVGVAFGAFAAVVLAADLVSHVALIATCSCALLALSLHGQHPVEDTYEAPRPLLDEQAEEFVAELEDEQAVEIVAELVDEQAEEIVAELVDEQVEEIAAELEVEEVLEVAVPESCEEVVEENVEVPVEAETDAVSVEESVEVLAVSAEWLNDMIAEGFIAKGSGDYAGAVQAFQRAMQYCADAGLSDMLNEELTDCYGNLRSHMEPSAPEASELKQGA